MKSTGPYYHTTNTESRIEMIRRMVEDRVPYNKEGNHRVPMRVPMRVPIGVPYNKLTNKPTNKPSIEALAGASADFKGSNSAQ